MTNRKLLVSVFNEQETREAIRGGGRIIDAEDPRGALGCISPLHVMAISHAAVGYQRDGDVQLSTNIGEEQFVYERLDDGSAREKSPYEIKSKSAQAAVGIAHAMGFQLHPCNIVKVGVDRMPRQLVFSVLQEIVQTLRCAAGCQGTQVMSVFFIQDLDEWNRRKRLEHVRRGLVRLRAYSPADGGDPNVFDLRELAAGSLETWEGRVLFESSREVSLKALIEVGALPASARTCQVKLNELPPHADFFPGVADGSTTRDVLRAMVDVTADAGAHAIMLDNRVQSKVARICSLDTRSEGLVDVNHLFKDASGLPYHGVLSLADIRFFVDYCHHRNLEANLAGSLQSVHAQQLWLQVPDLDQMANRDAASGVRRRPGTDTVGLDTRQHRVIRAELVRGIVPPEQGGVLNLPSQLVEEPGGRAASVSLVRAVSAARAAQKLGVPEVNYVDARSTVTPAVDLMEQAVGVR